MKVVSWYFWRYQTKTAGSIFFDNFIQGLHAQRAPQVLEVCPERARYSAVGPAGLTGSQGSVCVHGSLLRPWWDHLAAQTRRQHSKEKHRWLHWQVNPVLTSQHSIVIIVTLLYFSKTKNVVILYYLCASHCSFVLQCIANFILLLFIYC